VIWWKSTAKAGLMHAVGWLVIALGLSSCGDQTSMAPSLEQDVPPLAPPSQQGSPPSPPPSLMTGATGLKPLPTVQQVQGAVPSGRADPFSPLPVATTAADQSTSGGSRLLGVLTVGTQTRALISYGTSRGEICVGPRGRCSQDHPLVLPEGWSVLKIDAQQGCVQLAENGKAQELLCIA
jgi:hypothetical protein